MKLQTSPPPPRDFRLTKSYPTCGLVWAWSTQGVTVVELRRVTAHSALCEDFAGATVWWPRTHLSRVWFGHEPTWEEFEAGHGLFKKYDFDDYDREVEA